MKSVTIGNGEGSIPLFSATSILDTDMQLRTEVDSEKVPIEKTVPGEVYKIQGINRYFLRVITCASARDSKTEGFKFITLPDGIIIEMKIGSANLILCKSRISIC